MQGEWQGGDTGFSAKLRSRLGQECALCCARMRVKCTRLSIPDATRACSRCANIQTSAVSWLQRKSRHCGDARVIDVLLGLLNCWRWSCERKIPVCPLVGNSVNCQREIFHNQTCGQPTMHICGLGVLRQVAAPMQLPDAGRLGSNLLQPGLWPISQVNARELMVDIFELAMTRLPRTR